MSESRPKTWSRKLGEAQWTIQKLPPTRGFTAQGPVYTVLGPGVVKVITADAKALAGLDTSNIGEALKTPAGVRLIMGFLGHVLSSGITAAQLGTLANLVLVGSTTIHVAGVDIPLKTFETLDTLPAVELAHINAAVLGAIMLNFLPTGAASPTVEGSAAATPT